MESYEEAGKRALNTVWNAAGDYTLSPVFLAVTKNKEMDFYLNTMVGLIHKWFEAGPILALFRSFEGTAFQEQYESLSLIALGNAAFCKEVPERPVLSDLRRAYARQGLDESSRHTHQRMTELVIDAHFREILGMKDFLPKKERELLRALAFDGTLSSAEMKKRLQALLSAYFNVILNDAGGGKMRRLLIPKFLQWVPSSHVMLHNPVYDDEHPDTHEAGGRQGPKKHRFGRAKEEEEEQIREKLLNYFGPSVFNRPENAAIDRNLCTGPHDGCHLLFTNGQKERPQRKDSVVRSIYEDSTEIRIRDQFRRNLVYYEHHAGQFRNAIGRLREKIDNVLLTQQSENEFRSDHGMLDRKRAWRNVVFNEEKVFTRREIRRQDMLCVTLLLDASASQIKRQEIIAAEAYIIAEALRLSRIPTQIFSYCSTEGFTVLNRLKEMKKETETTNHEDRKIFRYAAIGWNRDGLALRGLGCMIDEKSRKHSLVLMLTDASPNDGYRMAVPEGHLRSKDYTEEEGIKDTAMEVRSLRRSGVRIAGIFYGSDLDWPSAEQIFGENVARIGDLSELASSAGTFIQKEIARLCSA